MQEYRFNWYSCCFLASKVVLYICLYYKKEYYENLFVENQIFMVYLLDKMQDRRYYLLYDSKELN
jgi:hypothetical protein